MIPKELLEAIGNEEKSAWMRARDGRKWRRRWRFGLALGIALALYGAAAADWWICLCAGWSAGIAWANLGSMKNQILIAELMQERARLYREFIEKVEEAGGAYE
jgi:hypothetical protein